MIVKIVLAMWAAVVLASCGALTASHELSSSASSSIFDAREPQCIFPEIRERVSRLGITKNDSRPAATRQVPSERAPLIVHYPETVQEAYARLILADAEASWSYFIDTAGWRRPRADGTLGGDSRFDFYIDPTLMPGVGGYAGFSGFDESTPEADAIGYIVVGANLDPRLRRGVVAHELHHAIQIAYDWWEDLAWMEASSTWSVDHVFDDENIYWRYFPFYQKEPHRPLDFISQTTPYQYGMALWPQFLDEAFDEHRGRLMRQIWERSAQTSFENKPNFLDATASLLGGLAKVDEAFATFGLWRMRLGPWDDGAHFKEGATWDERVLPTLALDVPKEVALPSGPLQLQAVGPLGHSLIRVRRTPSASLPRLITSEPHRWLIRGPIVRVIKGTKGAEEIWYDFAVSRSAVFDNYDPTTSAWDGLPPSLRFDTASFP